MKRFFATIVGCAALAVPAIATETSAPEAAPEASPSPVAVAEPAAEPTAEPAPQQELSTWQKIVANLPKVSGYLQTGWNYTTNKNGSTSSFQAKRLRLILDGKVSEKVDFRLQIEAFNGIGGSTNGNGQKNIQVMDAFATWKILPEFKVRFGQFYTPLGYENYDISPASLETVDFSNIVYRISCRNPYEYNFVDYGRELGVLFTGDAFDSGEGFRYLHYDFALTNGSLPSKDDSNNSKDIYASITVRPFKHFNIKTTYNYGEEDWKKLGGGTGMGLPESRYNKLHRMSVGAWYNDPNGLDVRAEYAFAKSKKNDVDYVKEQGAYAIVAYHAGKFLPLVRWDMYKDDVQKTLAGANYNRLMLGCNYQVYKNLRFMVNWGHFFYGSTVEKAVGYKNSDQIQIMGQFNF